MNNAAALLLFLYPFHICWLLALLKVRCTQVERELEQCTTKPWRRRLKRLSVCSRSDHRSRGHADALFADQTYKSQGSFFLHQKNNPSLDNSFQKESPTRETDSGNFMPKTLFATQVPSSNGNHCTLFAFSQSEFTAEQSINSTPHLEWRGHQATHSAHKNQTRPEKVNYRYHISVWSSVPKVAQGLHPRTTDNGQFKHQT